MIRKMYSVVVASYLLAVSAPVSADSTASPGKSAAYTSVSGVAVNTTAAEVATVTIEKGKKKRVLEVDGTMVETSNIATAWALRAKVNGIVMEPTGASFQTTETCAAPVLYCTVSGHWWLDLDLAEASAPGQFINVPLVVSLEGLDLGGAATGAVSLRARLVKK